MKFGIMDKLGGLSLEFPSRVIQLEKKKFGITEKLYLSGQIVICKRWSLRRGLRYSNLTETKEISYNGQVATIERWLLMRLVSDMRFQIY